MGRKKILVEVSFFFETILPSPHPQNLIYLYLHQFFFFLDFKLIASRKFPVVVVEFFSGMVNFFRLG